MVEISPPQSLGRIPVSRKGIDERHRHRIGADRPLPIRARTVRDGRQPACRANRGIGTIDPLFRPFVGPLARSFGRDP
ncbi:MAG TPA: hypothetical protein DCQ98_18235 [Planctomycetaceae bacterium]|nr:hypothetical protein [Planctomycetaceae bacterium]